MIFISLGEIKGKLFGGGDFVIYLNLHSIE